jgi:hypothetical protein
LGRITSPTSAPAAFGWYRKRAASAIAGGYFSPLSFGNPLDSIAARALQADPGRDQHRTTIAQPNTTQRGATFANLLNSSHVDRLCISERGAAATGTGA